MSLDSLEARLKGSAIRDPDDARSSASTQSPYDERLLQTDEIRLLTVEDDAGALRLRITPHKFQDDLEYDAISYVWGTAESSINVSCNGVNIAVTQTVFEMLQHLCPSRPYWLDSICINQHDSEEKAIQIPFMHRIYSRAAVVVIWMGMPTVQSEMFVAEFPNTLEKERKWTSMIAQNLQPWIHERGLLATDELFKGMLHLLEHDWFQRLWTFQECILAKRPIILHGHSWIKFDEFIEFIDDGRYNINGWLLHSMDNYEGAAVPVTIGEACETIRRYRKAIVPTGTVPRDLIPYLLCILHSRHVKEPVDRAWAITGLLSTDLRSKLSPLVDYSDNGRAHFWKTHIQFARTIMATEQTLCLLHIPPTIGERTHSVPSWCPTLEGTPECIMVIWGGWTYPVSGQEFHLLLEEVVDERNQALPPSVSDKISILHASRKFISFEKDGDYLKTCGCTVDTILEVVNDTELQGCLDYIGGPDISSHYISNPVQAANVNLYTRSLHMARRTLHNPSNSTQSIPPEYLMTLLCDTRISREAIIAYEHAWTSFIDREHNYLQSLPTDHQWQAMRWFDRLVSLTGHSFFSTTGGRFGIATPGCKPGDKVCVFYGEKPLHILRWPESENETGAIHGEGPAEFRGVAFIPHLMKPHEQEAARLGPDEIFVIG